MQWSTYLWLLLLEPGKKACLDHWWKKPTPFQEHLELLSHCYLELLETILQRCSDQLSGQYNRFWALYGCSLWQLPVLWKMLTLLRHLSIWISYFCKHELPPLQVLDNLLAKNTWIFPLPVVISELRIESSLLLRLPSKQTVWVEDPKMKTLSTMVYHRIEVYLL